MIEFLFGMYKTFGLIINPAKGKPKQTKNKPTEWSWAAQFTGV